MAPDQLQTTLPQTCPACGAARSTGCLVVGLTHPPRLDCMFPRDVEQRAQKAKAASIASAVLALQVAFKNAGMKEPVTILLRSGETWDLARVMQAGSGPLIYDPSSERHLTIYGMKFRGMRDN